MLANVKNLQCQHVLRAAFLQNNYACHWGLQNARCIIIFIWQ
jgi:hypothetical protein